MEEDEEITGPRKKQVKLLKQQLVKWKEQDRNLADQLKVMHEGISKRAKRLRRREDRLLFLNTELGKKVDALLDSQAATVQIGHQEKGLIESKVQKLMAEFIVPIRNGGNIVVKPIRKEEDESAFQISERLAKEHKAEAMQQSIADLIPGAEHKMEHVDLEQKIVMVEIQFNGKVTPFHIGPQTTFAELSILASPYYSLPSEDIFFSDEPGDARGRLFIRNQVIAAELYPWRTWKMTQDAQLFIVLGGYMSVEDKIALESEESMDEYQQEEQPEIMHLIKKPDRADVDEFQEKEQKGVKLKVKKRMKKHMLCN